MIIRLSQKLCTKIKAGTLPVLPMNENPLADWSAHLFLVKQTQYILLSHTSSLYSIVFFGEGLTDEKKFINRALSALNEFMTMDELQHVYEHSIAPTIEKIQFAKAISRSVTGSMRELVFAATSFLKIREMPPHEIGFDLNEILLSALGRGQKMEYGEPKEAFQKLILEHLPLEVEKPTGKRPLPRTMMSWFKEIKLAIADAQQAMPFGPVVGVTIVDSNLFHLAPHICLKFRGRKRTGREAEVVIKTALANYVVNSDPDGIDHNLERRPLMAFALCYVTAHLALDLLNERKAEAILNFCEDHFAVQ